jgi:ubiquinone biosynthesis protein COQ9
MFKKLNIKILRRFFCTKKPVDEMREKLIKMSLLNVSKYGWTENSIKIAANELNYSHNLSTLLEHGAIDLVNYTIDTWNSKLNNEIASIKQNEK